MKIIFLGTNGWYTTPTGNTPCILIDSKNYYVVLDAGNGIYQLDSYIKENKPIFLFVSHFHIDHVSGFHTLSKFKFPQGLDVCVAKGRKKDFDTLVNPPYTVGIENKPQNVNNLPLNVRVHELSEQNNLPFPVSCIELFHAYKNHGYRFQLDEKIIAYSGDTGICENSLLLAKNSDLLIHECSFEISPKQNRWGHVDPTSAAKLASTANVKKLVLTHFDASVYTSLEKRKKAQIRAQKIFLNTIAAQDGMIISL